MQGRLVLRAGSMQFIETSALGVRAARLVFGASKVATQVTLFPVVHVGERGFYEQLYQDALTHDVVLVEGLRSPITDRVTRSYRWLVGSHAMAGLIVQPKLVAEGAQAKIIHADLSHDEFVVEWRKVPLWMRALIYLMAPILGLKRRWFMSKTALAKDMQIEDSPSLKEILAISPETGALTRAILEVRDERLLERLRCELDSNPAPSSIAVIYGAAHMRAVLRELTGKRDFAVTGADWRTVMSLDQ